MASERREQVYRYIILVALLVYLLASIGDEFFHDPNWHPKNRILRWMRQEPPHFHFPGDSGRSARTIAPDSRLTES